MRKGFTLLELIVVIIIIGVLATLGFTQYGKMIEKARNAEAKGILGDVRKFAAAHNLEYGQLTAGVNIPAFDAARANIGVAADQIPSACRASHYFNYGIAVTGANAVTMTANRCAAAGKAPQAAAACTVVLTSDLAAGTDTWTGTCL